MSDESYLQVAPDSTGKKVRNLKITEPVAVDSTGAAQPDLVRYQQVVTAADVRGDLLADQSGELLIELRAIRAALEHLVMLAE